MESRGGAEKIQESIVTCIDWAKDWQMEFNLNKWKVLGWERTMKMEIAGCKG